jgi:outer membrane protein TolC
MKRSHSYPYLIVIYLFWAIIPLSGESLRLNLEACLEMALENNPDLGISRLDLDTARLYSRNSWNVLLPSLSADAGLADSSEFFTGNYDPSRTLDSSLDASITLHAGLAATAKGYGLSFEKEQITFEETLRLLISSVEKDFYYLITSASNLEIVKTDWDLSVKNYEQVKSNYDNGMASELSVLQARVSASNQEPIYKQTAAAHEAGMNNFLITIGLEPGTEIILDGDLETQIRDFDSKELINRYLPERLDIRGLIVDLEILKNTRKKTALTNRTPEVEFSLDWTGKKVDEADWYDDLDLEIDITLPLDDWIYGSSTSLSLKSLDNQIIQKQISLDNAYNEAETEILNLINSLNTAADNIRLSALNVELAEESFFLTEESFSQGLAQTLEVDNAQQDLFSAKQQYLSSQYVYLSGLIELRDALGLESLDDINL